MRTNADQQVVSRLSERGRFRWTGRIVLLLAGFTASTAFGYDRLIVSPSSLNLSETGTTSGTFSLRCEDRPNSSGTTVSVTLTPDSRLDLGDGPGVPVSRVFTYSDYDEDQSVSVTVVDDDVAQGPQTAVITLQAFSSDTGYNGVVTHVQVHITDDDVAAVIVSESDDSSAVSETGPTSDNYTLVLGSQPVSTVTVTVTPDAQVDLGDGAGMPITITFTTANWNVAQWVTVTAVDDGAIEGAHTSRIVHAVSSPDPTYTGIDVRDVIVSITDNDAGGRVIVTETDGSTVADEAGPPLDNYTLVLDSVPTNNVMITVTPDARIDLGAGPGVPVTKEFSPADWNVAQTVVVTAVDDDVAQGPHASIITHSAASSDARFNGISIASITVQIADNDRSGVVLEETDNVTAVGESGPTEDHYTLVLTSCPTANVDIQIIPDAQVDLGAGAGVAITKTFTPANWNGAQTVTVTAVDDAAPEGPHLSLIRHAVTSDDPDYNGFSVRDVTAHIADNDAAGVTITEEEGTTNVTEGGASDNYSLVLTAPPAATVTVTITTDGATTVNPATLTFTPADWNVAQEVTVAAVNDNVSAGARDSTIHHALASADPSYNGLAVPDVIARVTDDDASGVMITESGGATNVTEAGGDDSYTVVLTSQPTADVVIAITPDAQSTVSVASLTFTPADWNVARSITVTAVDDAAAEGPHTSRITHRASSSDPHYSGIAIPDVTAQVADNDLAGVILIESDNSTEVNEAGPTFDAYSLVLASPPTDNVTIKVTADGQTTVNPSTVTFTTTNWNVPQNVVVTAVNDSMPEGPHASRITNTVSSTDPRYNGLFIPDLMARVTDNDMAGVTIEESGGATNVNEQGTTWDNYTVVLNAPPAAEVTIAVTTDGKTTVNPATLTFTPADWDVPQAVIVTAVDDAQAEGTHDSTITHVASSTDANYNNVGIRNVIAHVTDNDVVGVTIAETDGASAVDEQGPTGDNYTIVLNTCPTADVTVTITADAQVSLSAATLTFTPDNWDQPQMVTVTAVDDAVAEGTHTTIIHHAVTSTDVNYSGVAARDLAVQITDNDMIGVVILETGGGTAVNEAGPTSDNYTVALSSPPTGDVIVTVISDAQVAASPSTLTFTPANWNVAQVVTVTAVDDFLAEGPHASVIRHSAASTDVAYSGIDVAAVTVHITDNDAPAVVIMETDGSTDVDEQGPTGDNYTIVLNTCPTADVTVTITADAQVSLSAATVTFTPDNWDQPQMVTVTAVDDWAAEGAHVSTITHTAAGTDPNYSGIAVRNVTVHVTDNDAIGVTIAESGLSSNVDEQGTTSDEYTVVLNTRPSADVTITITSDAQVTVAPGTLIFTPDNWNVAQAVTVTAVDDLLAEGAHVSTIRHTAASTDVGYSAISIRNVTVHVTDNDVAGVTITESDNSTDVSEEGPTSDNYTVVLTTPPHSATVTITVTPDRQVDLGAGAGKPIALAFTADDWNVPQVVTVTAVDDAVAEGPHNSAIIHNVASTDPNYNGIVVRSVVAAVTDDDCAAVLIDEANGSTVVNEAGPTSDNYTIVLSIAPTSAVTITVDPDAQTDVGAGPGVPVNLIFTTINWNLPQTVQVTAVDDDAAEGLHNSTISHTAVSADGNYNGIAIRNVVAAVIDNDFAGVLIVQTGGATHVDEQGTTSDNYTARLTLPPTSDVTITVTPDAQTTVSPDTLVFTPANWNVPQTITVTAVDDPVAEGAYHTSTITHTAASSDPNYNAITIAGILATVTDNDMSGVSVAESGDKTEVSEKGPTADTYTLVLSTTPTANVKIVVTPDVQTSVGAGAGRPVTLNFTPADWNVPQTVTLTAVPDGLAEGPHQSNITHTAFSSDSNYNGIAIKTVIAAVIDADTAGLTLAESAGATEVNEEGPTSDSYTMVLNTRPQGDVVISADPDGYTNLGEGPGVPVSRTFTPDNWDIPQTITVTAVDDTIAQGLHNSAITHTTSSTDRSYNGLTRVLTVVVFDNDVPGVTVTESGASTDANEQGTTSDTYTLQLNTPPRGNVLIVVDPDEQVDLGAGPAAPITLTFTPANWNVPQTVTVTAVDDLFAEGAHVGTITHQAASTDSTYNKITIRNVSVRLTDNDVAGVTLTEIDGPLAIREDGPTSGAYTLVLHTPPKADVTIAVMPDAQATVSPAVLTFTPANWNVPQPVTVTAVDDTLAEGAHTATLTHLAVSADPAYNGINVRTITVALGDNDFRGVAVVQTDNETIVDEAGRLVDSYDIVLTTPITADVVITAHPRGFLDLGAGHGQSIVLTFTPADWNIRQTITVRGVSDGLAAGLTAATIKHSISSLDGSYSRLKVDSVTVNIIDNDSASCLCGTPLIFILVGLAFLSRSLIPPRPRLA